MEVSKKSSNKRNRDCSKYEQLTIAPIKWLPCNICIITVNAQANTYIVATIVSQF